MLALLFAFRSSFLRATTLEVSLGAYSLAMASAKILSVFIVCLLFVIVQPRLTIFQQFFPQIVQI